MSPLVALIVFATAALVGASRTADRAVRQLGAKLDRLATFPAGAEILVFAIVLIVGAIPTLLDVVPPPSTPDEFAYLLAADTFAHGRLTNERHALWEHFETLHVLVTPTYSSKYPPALGMALALGQLIWKPIVGAFTASALAAAAVCWMLRARLPARWAILGGVLAGLHPQVFWWGQIYWGGSVAMIGGALLLGAAVRAFDAARASHGIVGALGIAILGNSRAYEGLILTLIVIILVLVGAHRAQRLRVILRRTALPALAVLIAAGAWMAYYNWRITRDPLQMPYTLYAKQYQVAPLFYWQAPREAPEYRHPRIAWYWTGYDLDEWRQQSKWGGFARGAWNKLRTIAIAFVTPVTLALALVGIPWAMTRRAEARRAAVVVVAFLVIHICTTSWMRMHYMGPVVPAFIALIVMCLMELHRLHVATAAIARGVVVVQLAVPVAQIVAMVQNPNPQGSARQVQVIDRLNSIPGDDLVLVAYTPGPQHLFEWVYNPADIDRSPIVFAHDMGPDRNRALLDYYPNRRAWRLLVDGDRFHLDPIDR